MKVALSGYFLALPHTGTGRYARRLLAGLANHPELELVVLPAPVHADGANRLRRGVELLAKVFNEQYADLVRARRLGADLVHFPYFAGPVFTPMPFVTTAHDLAPLRFPEYAPSALAKLYFLLTRAGAQRAKLIITDSQASAIEIKAMLGLAPARIKVVHLAPDPAFFEPVTGDQAQATLGKFGLEPDGYFFYPSGYDRRKNVGRLIVAYALLATRKPTVPPLVMAGVTPPPNRTIFDARGAVKRCGVTERIKFIGPIPDQELRVLYNQARAVVYPSLYEGFGLPPLEAMAAGAAVAVSNQSSLPEVAGDAALLFDPNDPLPISFALEELMQNDELVTALREAGQRQAGRYSWQRVLTETEQAYHEALN